MLWYKSWLDTRWRFLIGFAVLLVVAAGNVVEYLQVARAVCRCSPQRTPGAAEWPARRARSRMRSRRSRRTAASFGPTGSGRTSRTCESSRRCSAAAARSRGRPRPACSRSRCRCGATPGSPPARRSGSRSYPSSCSRARSRSPLLSPAIGEHYGVGEAVVHGASPFVASSVFFGLALLLSTAFNDTWRPLLLGARGRRDRGGRDARAARRRAIRRDERAFVLLGGRRALGGTARVRRAHGGTDLRRGREHRAPRLLTHRKNRRSSWSLESSCSRWRSCRSARSTGRLRSIPRAIGRRDPRALR